MEVRGKYFELKDLVEMLRVFSIFNNVVEILILYPY